MKRRLYSRDGIHFRQKAGYYILLLLILVLSFSGISADGSYEYQDAIHSSAVLQRSGKLQQRVPAVLQEKNEEQLQFDPVRKVRLKRYEKNRADFPLFYLASAGFRRYTPGKAACTDGRRPHVNRSLLIRYIQKQDGL